MHLKLILNDNSSILKKLKSTLVLIMFCHIQEVRKELKCELFSLRQDFKK